MPDRPRDLARPLHQGLAHHRDLRGVRRRRGRRHAARARRAADDLGARQRRDPVVRAVRMPGLAGQEHRRGECRAQRPVVGAAGGERLRGPAGADRRRARLPQRDGGAARLGRVDRRLGRDLGARAECDQAVSLRLRDPSLSRRRAGLAAAVIRTTPSSASSCAAIRCSATAPTGPTSPPAPSRR